MQGGPRRREKVNRIHKVGTISAEGLAPPSRWQNAGALHGQLQRFGCHLKFAVAWLNPQLIN